MAFKFIVLIHVHTLQGQSKRAKRQRVLMAAKLDKLHNEGKLVYRGINRRGHHVFANMLGTFGVSA